MVEAASGCPTTSTEATVVLSPLLSCVDQIEWMRLYLRGRMTDGCGTQSTRKGMGLVEKKCQFAKIIHHHGDTSGAVLVNSRLFQELERSVSYMDKVID